MPPTNDLHVLVIAHPDDESMFFVPTLQALKAANETVWILCLTTGDFEGGGKIRSKEMMRAGTIVGADNTMVCDRLKDDPVTRWDIEKVEQEIRGTLLSEMKTTTPKNQEWNRVVLISFDSWGVSGHVNHIDTHLGVYAIAQNGRLETSRGGRSIPVEMWSLVSERNMFAKYCPVVSWFLLLGSLFKSAVGPMHHEKRFSDSTYRYRTCRLHRPSLNWKAMATHASQFVWYRRLFVVFSSYTYVNRLERIQGTKTIQNQFS